MPDGLAAYADLTKVATRGERRADLEQGTARIRACIGGGPEGYFWVRSEGDGLVYRAPGEEEVRLVPTAGEWAAFWATVERLGVWAWEEAYETPGICDGTHWGVTLEHDGRSLESGGDNAFPGGDGPGSGRTFAGFCRAVGRLAGGREFR